MKHLRSLLSSLPVSLILLAFCFGSPWIVSGQAPVTVFNSFGPGNAVGNVAWAVTGAGTPVGYRGQAEWFIPTVSGYLSSITLYTVRYSGSGRSDFFLAEDSANSTPGNILESFPNTLNSANGLLNLNSASMPLLQAGVRY